MPVVVTFNVALAATDPTQKLLPLRKFGLPESVQAVTW